MSVNHIRQLKLIDSSGNVIAVQEPFVIYEGTATLQQYYHWEIKTTSTGLFHQKDIFDQGISWDESLKYLEDWELLLQMGEKFPNNFRHITTPLVKYTQVYGGDGLCSTAKYGDYAIAFEQIYQRHKNDPLMAGQKWYPDRIEKYTRLQKLVEEGKEPIAMYKYFPEFARKKYPP
jgi:hypothetical protein